MANSEGSGHKFDPRLDSGNFLYYSHLVLAVGSQPRELPLPGASLDGVHYLRNIDDVDRIRSGVRAGRRAVVIGGGYIGLEVATSLRMLGMEVTVLEALPRVLQRVTCETVSEFFAVLHREESVEIRTDTMVSAVHGNGKVSGVELASGEVIETNGRRTQPAAEFPLRQETDSRRCGSGRCESP